MEVKKLKVEDLIKSIEYISQIFSSSENMKTHMNSPIHIMIYNEISKYSKKELEEVTNDRGQPGAIYQKVMASRNSLLFAALMEKKAFIEKLTSDSKWLLKNIPPSPTLYETVFETQRELNDKRDFEFFMYTISKNLKTMDKFQQISLADKVYKDNIKKYEKDLIKYVFNNLFNKNEVNQEFFIKELLSFFKENSIDINENNLMNNRFLRKSNSLEQYSPLFISSLDVPSIEPLLKAGFKFEEEKFEYYGENLFVSVLKSGRADIVKAILPSLKMSTPKTITIEQQHNIIEMYKSKNCYTEVKEIYYAKYAEYLADNLSKEIPQKNMKEPIKVKI